jgi:hypothetical protein
MRIDDQLSRFERLAQDLIEGSLNRVFGQHLPAEIASKLARAMEDSETGGHVSSRFRVELSPEQFQRLSRDYPELATQLNDYLTQLASQGGYVVPLPIEVTFEPSESISMGRVGVVSLRQELEDEDEPTRGQRPISVPAALDDLKQIDAYLIVEGKRHVPLDHPVVTIGRRLDNDIVLELSTVSRRHAQIRWRYGRFILYDLGSRAGTAVNGEPIRERILQPGDVIGVSTAAIIYGEEASTGSERRPSDRNDSSSTIALPPDARP